MVPDNSDVIQPIRVMLAEDYRIVRAGIKGLIERADDLQVVEEAADEESMLDKLKTRSDLDLLVMDLALPVTEISSLIMRVRKLCPSLPVLFMHDSPDMISLAIKSGINGYVTKDVKPEKLIMAIRQIASGGSWFDQRVMDALINRRQDLPKLSSREQEVLKLIAKGDRNKQIARKLFISEKTVSTHKTNLIKKLNIKTTADLIRFADEHHLELGLHNGTVKSTA